MVVLIVCRIKFLKKKSNGILQFIAFCFGLRFFLYFRMLYHFRKLASLYRALFKVLLNQTLIFLLFNLFKLCLQGLDNLFQKNFVKFR